MAVHLNKFIASRLKRCRAAMAKRGLDGLIVARGANVRYLTGFSGDESVLVVTARGKVLVTDSRYSEQARKECRGLRLKVRKGPISEAVGEVLSGSLSQGRRRRKRVIGIVADSVTVQEHRAYRKTVGSDLRTIKGLVTPLRQCKDDYEVSQIRKAVIVAEEAMRAVLGQLRVGMMEVEVAALLDYEMARRGGPAAFETIVAYGGHGSQPHAVPGRTRLRQGHGILFDWGATIGGYRSDLTRCYAAGRIRPDYSDAYGRVLEAQLLAIEAIRPGVRLADVDKAARKALGRKATVYKHGTGHGLGLEVHEGPVLSGTSKGMLEAGMVITVEPGVYVPGRFGIRIEDDVLVTPSGSKVLSKLPKDIDSVSL